MPNGIHIRDFAEPAALSLGVGTLVTICHWRNWFYPTDMKLSDGVTPDPRAGRLDKKKMMGDFVFVPTLMIVGCLFVGLNFDLILVLLGVAVVAFVGSAFIMATFEKARDGALGVLMAALTNAVAPIGEAISVWFGKQKK